MTVNNHIIQVENLSKSYGDKVALDDISFSIKTGEIFALLGPNGAGKTSTLECLEGLRQPTKGLLRVAGIDPTKDSRKLRNLIGVQLQAAGLPENFTPAEAMRFFCAYHAVEPGFDLLERFGLHTKRNSKIFELSAGQQRRLSLTLAVAHDPKILFLDEPTAGLDVASRVDLHNLMLELKTRGTTIILATHDMSEAEEMSDSVAILLNGKMVTIGTPMDITNTGVGLTKISVKTVNGCFFESDVNIPAIHHSFVKEDYMICFSTDISPSLSKIISVVNDKKDSLVDLRVERPSLEDRFLEITQTGKKI